MVKTQTSRQEPSKEPIVIERVFDAPRDFVFRMWTEPAHMTRWWGPKDFTAPVCKIDLRQGGVFHGCMRSPEGRNYWSKGIYREIVRPEKLVMTDFFSDEEGNRIPPAHYGMSADWPEEALITVTFSEQEGKTKMTLRHEVGSAPANEREMCRQGWSESFHKLADYLEQATRAMPESEERRAA